MVNSSGISNPCIRCGKQRIVVSTEKELVGNSTVTRTIMSCPDPECQKKVEEDIERAREKRNQSTSFASFQRTGRR